MTQSLNMLICFQMINATVIYLTMKQDDIQTSNCDQALLYKQNVVSQILSAAMVKREPEQKTEGSRCFPRGSLRWHCQVARVACEQVHQCRL